ncbi:MAG: helix-turn-helix domain-containing protein [Candidatus Cybelea sp.]
MEDQGREPGFGTLLKHYRIAAGLSQDALAQRARMSADGISALERGHRRTPQRETLALLAGALALSDEQRLNFEAAAVRRSTPRLGGSVSVGPWPDVGEAGVPLSLTSFFGRENELAEISTLVRERRLVTITGAGGVGKTQTALRVANALADEITVRCVEFAPISYTSLVVSAIASALGVQEIPTRPLLGTVTAYLRNRTMLLVLDNCEHVISEVVSVATVLLVACPHLRILATSREAFKAAGEFGYRLPSLTVESSVRLFADRAQAVNHRFALTDETAPIVAEICSRLDGIPLAIELAAARTNLLPVRALAEKLDERFRVLGRGERTAMPRQQTMRAAIEWSCELLSPREQRVFERLSVFAGGCTLDAAATVCADEEVAEHDLLDLLSSLIDKSLVVVDFEGSEPRYRLLESFRQYAREKLAARDEQNVVAHRHAYAYLKLAEPLDCIFFYKPDEVLQAQSREELDNWRAALQWSLSARRDVLLGQRLVGELCPFWQILAPVEGRRWLTCALELADPRTPTSLLARLDYTEAMIAQVLGQYEVQLASSRSAAERYRLVGDSFGVALAQHREISALVNLSRCEEAKPLLQEFLPLARRLGNRWLLAMTLRLFGSTSLQDGDLAAARAYVAEALQHFEALGSTRDVAFIMLQLSGVEFHAGNAELALWHTTDALATFRTINLARAVGGTLNLRATFLISLARYDEAETNAREAFELARELRLEARAACALEQLAVIATLQPQVAADRRQRSYARAARAFGFADARRAAAETPRESDEQQDYARALALLRDALGTDALARLIAEGAAMTEEQAVEETLS